MSSQAVLPRWTGMAGLGVVPTYVVMQPSTLCNLDCAYCYLPDRAYHRAMSREIAERVARAANGWARRQSGFAVVWHGGEPLAVGRKAFADLIAPFDAGIEHQVQTNATLIDDAWCGLFRDNRVRVSISVDGPPDRNTSRRNRAHRPVYDMIMHGVDALHRNDIPFAALCVVSDPQPGQATELYRYFVDLGCDALGINIEEHEGINTRSTAYPGGAVRAFWAELAAAWRADPRIRVREIDWSLRYAAAVLDGTVTDLLPAEIDPIPAVNHDGSVLVLSPELAGFTDPRYGDFTIGSVLDRPLEEIVAGAASTGWVGEYLDGVVTCRDTCPYFGFCGGAHAGNRYFELGSFAGTRTNHCRNSKIRLLDGVLDDAASLAALVGPAAPAALPAPASGPGGVDGQGTDPLTARIRGLGPALALLSGGTRTGDGADAARADECRPAFYNWNNRPR